MLGRRFRSSHRRFSVRCGVGERSMGIVLVVGSQETWALITWLVYATYLHSRLVAGWSKRIRAPSAPPVS